MPIIFSFERYIEIIDIAILWNDTYSGINGVIPSDYIIKSVIYYTLVPFDLFNRFLLLHRYSHFAASSIVT
jgi:hypothetical protein